MNFVEDPHDFYPNEASKIHLDFRDLTAKSNTILHHIFTYQVLILNSSPFSSKTFFIPELLLSSGFADNGWHIGIVFPSRGAAVSKSNLLIQLFRSPSMIGLSLDVCENTTVAPLIRIMTVDSLLEELKKCRTLDSTSTGYSVIYFENFCASGTKGELCLGLLNNVIEKRKEFKLIIGTVFNDGVSEILSYFNGDDNEDFMGFSPINLKLAYALDLDTVNEDNYILKHLPVLPDDPKERCLLFLQQLHETEGSGNVLLYLPSGKDCLEYSRILGERKIPNLVVVFGDNVTFSSNELKRYVFFASSIYQIDRSFRNIKYVIDCGLIQRREFDFKKQWTYCKESRITQKEANIRSAVAAFYPNGKGIAFRMFPPGHFNEEVDYSMIQDFHQISLSLFAIGIKNLKTFKFYRRPSMPLLSFNLNYLNQYGIISNNGELTSIGEKAINFFNLPICLARFLVASFEQGCTEDAIKIISMMTLNSKFEFGSCRMREGDLLSLYHFYKPFTQKNTNPEYKQKIQQIKHFREILLNKCQLIGKISHTTQTEKLIYAIVSGFFQNAAVFNLERQVYIHLITKEHLYIHPCSVLKDLDMRLHVHYVVFESIEYYDRPYMKNITVVDDPSLFVEIAPKLYTEILGNLPSSHRQKPIRILDESVIPSSLSKPAHSFNYYQVPKHSGRQ